LRNGQRIALGEFFHLLWNLVQRAAERLDVLALDRGDEAVHQRLADAVGGFALTPAGEFEGIQLRLALRVAQHLVQCLGTVVRRTGGIFQQGVELIALAEHRLQGEHGGALSRRAGACRAYYAGLMTFM